MTSHVPWVKLFVTSNVGGARMGKTLVIVESPAKVRTLSKFLGRQYTVKASIGHVRDLPKSKLGVDVENGYTPEYINIRGKGDVIRELREAAKKADKVLLATDPDREGEAISWHLAHILKIDPASDCRIEFNEITENAVRNALKKPRPVDMARVDAQQARRVLDRLVGYNLSPFLWRKVRRGLSAGRVQSSALKLICDREREIQAFTVEEYWTLAAALSPGARGRRFLARLVPSGEGRMSRQDVDRIVGELEGAEYVVKSVTVKEQARKASPPFTTSTMQQEAFRKLGFSARRTMSVAQQLYEGVEVAGEGHVALITYMRTDSTRVSHEAQAAARDFVKARYGESYLPERVPVYKSKKGAQDAHEAIRPTRIDRVPESLSGSLGRDQLRLYKLIWSRFMASQMANALYDATTVDIDASGGGAMHVFRATGQVMKFDGFSVLYTEGRDDDKNERDQALPPLEAGKRLTLIELVPEEHHTQPPPRFTEATLVRELEKHRIGRPSTYAPIIDTIRKREYATLEQRRFKPTDVGFAVCDLLSQHFPTVVNLEFTASMEDELDEIEEKRSDWVQITDKFYKPFSERLREADAVAERVVIADEPTDEDCPQCGLAKLVIKTGRFGKFIACPRYPECAYRRSITRKIDAKCPVCGGDMAQRRSKRGRVFYGCARYPECEFVSWNPPSGVMCPKCASFTTSRRVRAGVKYKCANPKCGHEWAQEQEDRGAGKPEASTVAE